MIRCHRLPLYSLFGFIGLLSTSHAQTGAVIRSKTYEVGGFLGASYGLDKFRVMGGGNVSYAATKYLLPYVEYSYFPGLPRQVAGSGGSSFYKLNISDFHAGVHIRGTIPESRFAPYGVIGVGLLHYPRTRITDVVNGQEITREPAVSSATDFAVNFGAGLRYYATPRAGFRVEYKLYKPTGLFTSIFSKVEGGVFLQLP